MKGDFAPVRVLCLGNDLLADDSLGGVVAERLRKHLPPPVGIVFTPNTGFSLLDDMMDAQRLVVVDTVLLHFQAWKKMFNEYGHEFTFEDYKQKVDGIPRYDGARAILTELPENEVHEAGDKKQGDVR